MSTNNSFDSLCTITLPDAKNYLVNDVLNLISFALRNKISHLPTDSSERSFSRWNAPSFVYSPEQSNDEIIKSLLAHHPSETVTHQFHATPNWDERTSQLKLDLIQRLHRAASNRDLELWQLSCVTVKEPPTNKNDAKFWAETSSIFKTDLITFCKAQKVKVEFENAAGLSDAEVELTQLGENSQACSVATTQTAESSLTPPGKIPKVAIGKLTVAAAWELELSLGRRASPSEVMKCLQQWVETHEGDTLKNSTKKNCVNWETQKGKPKEYDLEACGAALRTWHNSRA